MATVKTIKPAGGGDYTTLSTWWTFAAAQATADQWAECYTGGDLGVVTLDGMTATPTVSNYPRIYVAEGQGHGGSRAAGAYISVGSFQTGIACQTAFTRIEGLRVNGNEVYSSCIGVQIDSTNILIESCYANATVGGVSGIYAYNAKVRNCIAYGADISGDSLGTIQNCSTFNSQISGGVSGNITNCVSAGTFAGGNFAGGTLSHCASSDSSADPYDMGNGNLINQVATDLFTNPSGSDFTLKTGSALRSAGVNLTSVFTTDIAGNTRPAADSTPVALKSFSDVIHYPKPGTLGTTAAWDIGAFQNSSGAATQQPDEVEGGARVNTGGRWQNQSSTIADNISIDRGGLSTKLNERFDNYDRFG